MKGYLEALHNGARYAAELCWWLAVWAFWSIVKLAIWRKKLCRKFERKRP